MQDDIGSTITIENPPISSKKVVCEPQTSASNSVAHASDSGQNPSLALHDRKKDL